MKTAILRIPADEKKLMNESAKTLTQVMTEFI